VARVTELAVWMDGYQVGTLTRHRGTLAFAYAERALRHYPLGAPLVSVALLNRKEEHRGQVVKLFFEGLLPEGEARDQLASDFAVDPADTFALLAALGRDCAGALVIVPEGERPDFGGRPEPITSAEIARRLADLRFTPLGADEKVRVSLAGMQSKLLLSKLADGSWGLPVNGAPSTHLLKPQHPNFQKMMENEEFSMRVAAKLGLEVPHVEIADFAGTKALVIERYDRTTPDQNGAVTRLHQEDFCQALTVTSDHKYEGRGGPSFRRCAELLTQWGSAGDLEKLLGIMVCNTLVSNADCHAKNLSVMHHGTGALTLAPAYDIVSTAFYPQTSQEPGMYISGKHLLSEVTRDDLIDETIGWGISRTRAEERVCDLLDRGPEAVHAAASETEAPDELVMLATNRANELRATSS
jgi:serine/threonine-protein kinase HipA